MRYVSRALPPALRAIVDELVALEREGRLTGEAFDDAWRRAVDTIADVDDRDERKRLLDPVLDFGEGVGRLRE